MMKLYSGVIDKSKNESANKINMKELSEGEKEYVRKTDKTRHFNPITLKQD
jgi:hypothetical protein